MEISSGNQGGRQPMTDFDVPPYSRVFVVCSKTLVEEDLRSAFGRYGQVENVRILKDKVTRESRGLAFVKFSKMSQATLAVEELHGKCIGKEDKPMKVEIAKPHSNGGDQDSDIDLTRVFLSVPRSMLESDIEKEFSKFGIIDNVKVVRKKDTMESKGVAFATFRKPTMAAVAVENADRSFKAVIAEPKGKIRSEPAHDMGWSPAPSSYNYAVAPQFFNVVAPPPSEVTHDTPGVSNRLEIRCSPYLTRDQLAGLLDLIPGLEFVDLKKDFSTGGSKGQAVAVYSSVSAAVFAKEKLNGFEYPPEQPLSVRYILAEPQAITLPQSLPSSLPAPLRNDSRSGLGDYGLPPTMPFAQPGSTVAARLYVVCSPRPLPEQFMRDLFSRFGNLIDVYMLKGKNFGYAKFSNARSAEQAMLALNNFEVQGVRIRVVEADPPKTSKEPLDGSSPLSGEMSSKRPRV